MLSGPSVSRTDRHSSDERRGKNMTNGDRATSGRRDDWRVRVATMVGVAVAAAIALLLRRDLGGFWPGVIAFALVIAIGGILGRLAVRRLFRPPSGGSSDHPPQV
jgi:hypothetical protein